MQLLRTRDRRVLPLLALFLCLAEAHSRNWDDPWRRPATREIETSRARLRPSCKTCPRQPRPLRRTGCRRRCLLKCGQISRRAVERPCPHASATRRRRQRLAGGRTAYGKQILATVSQELTAEFGAGFSAGPWLRVFLPTFGQGAAAHSTESSRRELSARQEPPEVGSQRRANLRYNVSHGQPRSA